MAAFAIISITGLDRITAKPNFFLPGAVNITLLDEAGQQFEVTASFGKDGARYARDLATSINRTANSHGRLTHDEQADLIGCVDEEEASC